MTLIKMNFVGSLRASEILKRLSGKDVSPTAQYHLLYTCLKLVSTKVAPFLSELERRVRSYPDELNALLAECHYAYFLMCKILLVPSVTEEIQGLDPGRSDLVELMREGLWLPQATLHRRVDSVSRILWQWRGHVIVSPQARYSTSLVTRPPVSTSKPCAIYFTTTSARGSCTNHVLLSFAKSVRSYKLSWSSMHGPHLRPAHQLLPPMPMVQTHQMMMITSPSHRAPPGPPGISPATPRPLKGATTEWENGYISATFLRWCSRMRRRGCSSKRRRSSRVRSDITFLRRKI